VPTAPPSVAPLSSISVSVPVPVSPPTVSVSVSVSRVYLVERSTAPLALGRQASKADEANREHSMTAAEGVETGLFMSYSRAALESCRQIG